MQNRFLNYALICMVLSCLGFASNGPANSPEQTKVSIAKFYRPNHPTYPETSRLIKLMKEDKTLQLEEWGGITLPGGGAKASLMMSIAGDTAPDIGEAWFHIIQSEIENGFLYPLNEWIGEDTNGNGIIDDEEAKWEPWKKIPPLWRRVAMRDGKVYGIPQASKNYMGVIFRTDLVRAAGLNPNNPPETWDEFKVWLHKLSITKNGNQQKGICLTPWGWTFLPWIQAAGGTPLTQYRISPETGERVYFSPEETNFIAPNGEDLNGVESFWKANFDSPETIEAAQLYHDIIWQKWIRHPKTGETILLEKADIAAGKVTFKEEEISFSFFPFLLLSPSLLPSPLPSPGSSPKTAV